MLGIIVHEKLLDSSPAELPQTTFNFDLLKQYEYVKRELGLNIIDTMVLLDNNQYMTFLARHNAQYNKLNTCTLHHHDGNEAVIETKKTNEQDFFGIDYYGHTSNPKQKKKLPKKIQVQKDGNIKVEEEKKEEDNSLLGLFCLKNFENTKIYSDDVICEFLAFIQFHSYYDTVMLVPLPLLDSNALLIAQVFATCVMTFRSKYPAKKDNRNSCVPGKHKDAPIADLGGMDIEHDLIGREIDNLFEADNDDEISSMQPVDHLKLSLFGVSVHSESVAE